MNQLPQRFTTIHTPSTYKEGSIVDFKSIFKTNLSLLKQTIPLFIYFFILLLNKLINEEFSNIVGVIETYTGPIKISVVVV